METKPMASNESVARYIAMKLDPDLPGEALEENVSLMAKWLSEAGFQGNESVAAELRKRARDITVDYDLHCEAIDDPDPDWLTERIVAEFSMPESLVKQLDTGRVREITAEMVQHATGKFGADLPWCRSVADRLNVALAVRSKP